jgi:hypothetical protein
LNSILARVPITALSRFKGHTSITVTLDRYGHIYPAERAAAVEAFEALFQDAARPAELDTVPAGLGEHPPKSRPG